MTRLISVFLLLCFFQTCFAASQCYYPDGRKSGDFPCDPDADESVCCSSGLGNVCLSNKLCQGGNGNTVRGSCTDKDWTSPECPLFCLNADTGGTDLISCSNVTKSDTSYCCDHIADCCDSGVGRFNIQPSSPDVWATWDRDSSRYDAIGTLFSGATTSSSVPASTTSTSTSTTSSTSSTTSTARPTIALPETSPVAQPSLGLSTGAKAGIGAGAGIGAIVIAVLAFLLWKRRKDNSNNLGNPPAYPGKPPMDERSVGGRNPSYYEPKYPRDPQELHGHQFQGYSVRAELPAHNL